MTVDSITVPLGEAQLIVPTRVLVRTFLEKHANGAAQPPTLAAVTPRIGEVWPGQGGIYAGTFCDPYGKPTHHLILAEAKVSPMTWQDAKDWAAKLEAGGHADFRLPSRIEGLSLFMHLADRFDKEWHWLDPQCAPNPGCAWIQNFSNGNQYGYHKDNRYRARAVRQISLAI